MEQQADWAAHRSFMNSLVEEGFVVLGGPLEGTPDVLLVVRAATPDEAVSRLEEDPWTRHDLLRTTRAVRWELRLGTLV
ncbi:MAG: YciI family protein [Candidatus Polarisedimenticolia bacterium]